MSSVDATLRPFFKGKSTFWDAQMSFCKWTEVMYTFIELGNSPLAISEENTRLLELFILYVYIGKDHRYTDINNTRCTSFFKSPVSKLTDTVLSKEGLIVHIKQSAYQACWLWKECFDNLFLPVSEISDWKPYFELCLDLTLKYFIFLDGNQKILKQPFKMLCQYVEWM